MFCELQFVHFKWRIPYMKPSIQFVKRKDGVKIAYSKLGVGQPLVFPPPWVTSLAFFFEDPFSNQFIEQLSRKLMVVVYDKHGCGQSDRNRKLFTLESELLDLETVVDHLNLTQFNLLGVSASGPISIAYVAQYPERVARVILYGTYADGKTLARKEVQSAIISLVRASWGLGSKALADIFVPDAKSEELQSIARYQKMSSSSEIAANLLELFYNVDVTDSLYNIEKPTLILHREDDKATSIHHGRQLASEIPNSNFKILSGNAHPIWYGESNKISEEILKFLGEGPVSGQVDDTGALTVEDSDTVDQATIVFTDIVSSTDIVTQVGDSAARDLFLKHDNIIRNQLTKHGGKQLQNLGDGFMLSFKSATAAIKCACRIQQQISKDLPTIQVRIGINTGEVVRREGKHPFGQAVVVASRIVSECKGGQLFVSDVTKQLTAGSGFSFIEKGTFQPKGINDSIRLFEVVWAE
jgi:class 3 adenylate cyclase/pimeloyl-ACP methyl ester carboxylesterase